MRLRDWRKSVGWSQERLAAEIGKSQMSVSRLEAGARALDHDEAALIYALTRGAVTPNDFYDLPPLPPLPPPPTDATLEQASAPGAGADGNPAPAHFMGAAA